MENDREMQLKILSLVDTLSVELASMRNEVRGEFSELRTEVRTGFQRVDRGLGNLENRVENLETDLRSFRGEFERRIEPLER
jgi:hypothetical protein